MAGTNRRSRKQGHLGTGGESRCTRKLLHFSTAPPRATASFATLTRPNPLRSEMSKNPCFAREISALARNQLLGAAGRRRPFELGRSLVSGSFDNRSKIRKGTPEITPTPESPVWH